MKKYGTFPFYGNGFLNNNGYAQIVQSTVGGGAIDAPSNVSRRTVWRKNHLKRRSFLVASSSPPWLNLYFCCYATKIKEKDHVRLADIYGSKSLSLRYGSTRYFIPNHTFSQKRKYITFGRAEYFIREAYFTFSPSAKIYH